MGVEFVDHNAIHCCLVPFTKILFYIPINVYLSECLQGNRDCQPVSKSKKVAGNLALTDSLTDKLQ